MDQTPAFYRRTPPVLFPCLLGFLGLGLAWRSSADFGAPIWIGELICFLAAILFVFTFLCYATKLCLRPSVVLDDLKIGPARGAVSAGSMCLMLLAFVIFPYDVFFAKIIWWFGVALHFIYLGAVIYILRSVPNVRQVASPVLYLPFVGIIVAAAGGVEIAGAWICQMFIVISIPFFVIITVISLDNAFRNGIDPANRASMAIILAPFSIYSLAAFNLGFFDLFWILSNITLGIAIVMFANANWFLKGGWKPSWGALTFPVAAFANVMTLRAEFDMAGSAQKAAFDGIAFYFMIVGLVVASLLVPFIVYKTYRCWGSGKLAEMTKAAIA